MPIRDLLWACPECRTFASIHDAGRGTERCSECDAVYRRGPGASILVATDDGTRTHSPAELVDRLPPVSTIPLENGRLGPVPALVRIARTTTPIRDGDDFLGKVEIFGPDTSATVTLDHQTLAAGIPERPLVWPLETITSVQPSSSTLQINSRSHPLVSFRFINQSVRLWEQALHERIRHVHAAAGRGNITRFHPRIRFA